MTPPISLLYSYLLCGFVDSNEENNESGKHNKHHVDVDGVGIRMKTLHTTEHEEGSKQENQADCYQHIGHDGELYSQSHLSLQWGMESK